MSLHIRLSYVYINSAAIAMLIISDGQAQLFSDLPHDFCSRSKSSSRLHTKVYFMTGYQQCSQVDAGMLLAYRKLFEEEFC